MMMKMLDAGGMEILTDHIRTPDQDNPQGYYEFERVKKIEHDQEWLPHAEGKAVKLISALLKHLPPTHRYRVVFMQRKMGEILGSQKRMLIRRGEPDDKVADEEMAAIFERHLAQVEAWLDGQANVEVMYVRYDQVVQDPLPHAQGVNAFLGGTLNTEEMARAVDPTLYRQRR